MGAILTAEYYGKDGKPSGIGVSVSLPDYLDWKGIDEKSVFVRYMGGMPEGTTHCLIKSQGEQLLLTGLEDSCGKQDIQTYKRKMENVEYYLEEECRRLGIDRTRKPRNQ